MINTTNWIIARLLIYSFCMVLTIFVQADLHAMECQNAKTDNEISECDQYKMQSLISATSSNTKVKKEKTNTQTEQLKAQKELRTPNCNNPSGFEMSCCSMHNTCGGFGFKRPGDTEK